MGRIDFCLKNLEWSDFFVANAAVVVAGVCAAQVGWRFPSFALLLPSLQLINGLFFHVIPTIVWRKFSPGVITSCLLFFPIGILAYWGAWVDEALLRNSPHSTGCAIVVNSGNGLLSPSSF